MTDQAPRAPSGEPSDRERLSSLDGIRAFAVVAVILYHAGITTVDGGLLGVDVFFVLSGFLITSLLCSEHAKRGGIRLGQFWAARARRLLPGLFVLLLGVSVYAWGFRQTLDLSSIRGDAIATLLYVANWHFVVSGQGYFQQSLTPSPLLHMWSLAVEEQYYLIWPLITLFVLSRRGPRTLALVAAIGAALSALLMGTMYLAGFSTDRLYYGTDTRAQALLLGAALGALASQRSWRIISANFAERPIGRVSGAVTGIAGAASLIWFWHDLNGQNPFLYEGGFLLVAVASAAVLTNVTSCRKGWLSRFLSIPPIVYIGRISYGLYLYHWPLFLAIDHAHTGLSAAPLLIVRLLSALAAAVLSFHLIEQPIRKGSFARTWRGLGIAGATAAATCALVVVATIPPAFASVAVSRQPTHVTKTLHQRLAKTHAFTTNPIRFMLVGDSVAFTTANGLEVESVPHYGVDVIRAGILGCDLTTDASASLIGGVVYPYDGNINCGSWPETWTADLSKFHPQVVGLLIGRFEFCDHEVDGKWVNVGEPAWDSQLLDSLNQAIKVLSSQGAHVVVYTFPFIDPPQEAQNGTPFPENEPSRVVAWNRLLADAVHDNPKVATLVNLNKILDPDGRYTNVIDGVQVRLPSDGIHLTIPGGEWLQPRLLPQIAKIGLEVHLPS